MLQGVFHVYNATFYVFCKVHLSARVFRSFECVLQSVNHHAIVILRTDGLNHETELYNYLFGGEYNPKLRPREDTQQAVDVTLTYELNTIGGLVRTAISIVLLTTICVSSCLLVLVTRVAPLLPQMRC